MAIYYFLIPVLSCSLAFIITPFARKIALKINLTDKPGYRKVHQKAIPLVGGLVIFITLWLTVSLFNNHASSIGLIKNLFVSSLILMLIGTLDDKFDINFSVRLIIQLILAHYMFSIGIRIESFYGIFGITELSYWQQYVINLVVITGVINAFNLIDGIDGLAGGLAIIASIVLAIISYLIGNDTLLMFFLALIGTLTAFLRFNFHPTQKIFMGDAGSMTLGFLISVTGISLLSSTLRTHNNSWILIGVISILIIPVLDALRVFRKRLKAGLSPFHADKTHLHHLILFLGLKHKAATILLITSAIFMIIIGFLVNSYTGITWSIVSMILIFYLATSILQYHNTIIIWRKKIKEMETKSINLLTISKNGNNP